ncbi:MAG: hypothetical protein L0226_03725 [Acidobacteria bacterium]|nr:hypothetical protein [Acidobacteriota bacterium]
MVTLQYEPFQSGVFKVPGGRIGGLLIGSTGFVITLLSLVLACIPTEEVGNVMTFYLTVFGALAANLALGIVIYIYGRRRAAAEAA